MQNSQLAATMYSMRDFDSWKHYIAHRVNYTSLPDIGGAFHFSAKLCLHNTFQAALWVFFPTNHRKIAGSGVILGWHDPDSAMRIQECRQSRIILHQLEMHPDVGAYPDLEVVV
jgi:hypothetical protein